MTPRRKKVKIRFENLLLIIAAILAAIILFFSFAPTRVLAQPLNIGAEDGWLGWEPPTGGHNGATIVSGGAYSGTHSFYLTNGWMMQIQPATATLISFSCGGDLETFAVTEDGTYNTLTLATSVMTVWTEWSGDISGLITPGDSFWIFGAAGSGWIDDIPIPAPASNSTVPEPCTLLLVGTGIFSALLRKKI